MMKWIVIGALVVMGLIYLSRSEYRAFEAERAAWHRRCDVYAGQRVTTPAARQCQAELARLIAYATRKGWLK